MQIVVANVKGGCGKTTLVAALADVLKADVVDHDNQGTITVSSRFTKRLIPVKPDKVTSRIVIHDTPPYHTAEMSYLLKEADLVLIPCKLRYPDLIALKIIVSDLTRLKLHKKAVVVFNEVRKPPTHVYKQLKQLFSKNYSNLKIAKTELSNLVAFSKVLASPLSGQALEQIKALVGELSI